MKKLIGIAVVFFSLLRCFADTSSYNELSPNGHLHVNVSVGERVFLTPRDENGRQLQNPVTIYLNLADGRSFGRYHPKVLDVKRREINRVVTSDRWTGSSVLENFREMEVIFSDNYSLFVRVYNDAIAYRFADHGNKPLYVYEDVLSFMLDDETRVFASYSDDHSSFEPLFPLLRSEELVAGRKIVAPLLLTHPRDGYMLLGEVANHPYPGLFMQRPIPGQRLLKSYHSKYPRTVSKPGGDHGFVKEVSSREDYIAHVKPQEELPWRYFLFTKEAKNLIDHPIHYLLSEASTYDDQWVIPGMAAWDWWSDWNLEGVPFETGSNYDTYRYFIDFAASNGLEYVVIDDGWTDLTDITFIKPEMRIEDLVSYAEEKGVSLIVWVAAYALYDQLESVLDLYARIGFKGIKVDFFNRNDQQAVAMIHKIAAEAMERKMVVDFHGAPQPGGIFRQYPNILSYEAVAGNEFHKWTDVVDPVHNVTFPFIRSTAGPVDYTPGALKNVSREVFVPSFSNPMVRGTRCHQLAMYVVYFSSLQMLCDSPTGYEKEPQLTRFIADIPVVWDESITLEGKPGEYIAVARRKGADWYLGVMNSLEPRKLRLDLSMLTKEKDFKYTLYRDGVNVHRLPADYLVEDGVLQQDNYEFELGSGGGALMRISPL